MNVEGQLLGKVLTQDIPRELHTFGRRVADAHAKRAQVLVREEAPKLTDHLAQTTTIIKQGDRGDVFERIVVPTAPYTEHVHEGTGLFGPYAQRIYPKLRKVLRWVGAGGQVIFARSTAGQRPNRFLDRAFNRLKVESDRLIDRLWKAL